MIKMKNIFRSTLLTLLLCSCGGKEATVSTPLQSVQTDFSNLLNIKNVPDDQRDRTKYVFTDYGAWGGYALPYLQSRRVSGAFIGPMLMSGQGWVSRSVAIPELKLNDKPFDFFYDVKDTEYLPGRLVQKFGNVNVAITSELCYASRYEAVIRTTIKNLTTKEMKVNLAWGGDLFSEDARVNVMPDHFACIDPNTNVNVDIYNAKVYERGFKEGKMLARESEQLLAPGAIYVSTQSIWTYFGNEGVTSSKVSLIDDSKSIFNANASRWNGYLAKVLDRESPFLQDNTYRRVIVKAMNTLNNNWRAPLDDLLYDGSYPSYCGFFGFWSWDSWKHASATTLYNPELAKNEVRSLFAYQDKETGMIPDYVSRRKERINWRDSKPPLSTWAVHNIYRESGDKEFVKEMFDRLLQYHYWWYSHRDHDGNGICEYGSTDGTLIAAAWESGMDNGVRFDDAIMLKNKPDYSWSMNQENICLNSFLYAEKLYLAELAELIGRSEVVERLQKDAAYIKEYIQTKMYDAETGFFYDRKLETGELVKVMGAECWLPLWAGVATPEQARNVADKMINPNHFFSTVPLGTLDVSHPKLRPINGYWRGPVWIDQVYFGVTGLKKYGMHTEANRIVEQYIHNAYGLTSDGPIHENYNPLTGEPLNCPHFGWSSATTILMLLNL